MKATSNNLLIKSLTEYGLSEREAVIYLSLLELEIASANEIAQNAGVKRSSAYVVLEALKKKGLAGVSEDQKIQKYVATPPEALLYSIESEVKEREATKIMIEGILPELKALHKGTKEKPKVRVFEGKIGLMSALEETLVNKEKILRGFSTGNNILKIPTQKTLSWAKKREELGIRFDAIFIDNKATRILVNLHPKIYRVAFVPPDNYPFPVDMMIWDNKVGYLITEKNNISTIIVESKEVSSMTKGMFDMALEEAKRKWGKYEENLP